MTQNTRIFFELVKIGLFPAQGEGVMIHDSFTENVNWEEVYKLAEEQSVIGLVAAGIENLNLNANLNFKVPQEWVLQFVGQTLQIEQRNKAMNGFINVLLDDLSKAGIFALIVKGQGVAQCYEKPLWRSSGDIDFYLKEDDFLKAKRFFRPLVDKFDPDDDFTRHINMHYGDWVVEIHANQNCSLSPRINRVMLDVHKDIFYSGSVRSWNNNGYLVFLPSANNDAIIIFTHFLNHFYRGGVGIRQICDWCRLLYTYKESLDLGLLEKRLKKAGLLCEWRAFGALAVEYLGMPVDAMPFYSDSAKWKKKTEKILDFVLEVGNFGHNRDSNYMKYPYVIRKCFSMGRRIGDSFRHARIFPLDSLRFFPYMMFNGVRSAMRGE